MQPVGKYYLVCVVIGYHNILVLFLLSLSSTFSDNYYVNTLIFIAVVKFIGKLNLNSNSINFIHFGIILHSQECFPILNVQNMSN